MATASLNSLNPAQIGQATALVSLVGFAIQQAVQAFDTFVSAGIDMLKAKRPSGTLPGGLTDADFKKSVMVFLSFSLGLAAVLAVPDGKLYLLRSYAGITTAPIWLDHLVSALVFSAGTEGANTVLKYFGYVKDARKKPAIELDVVPKTGTVSKGATLQFIATARNGEDSTVTWRVLTGGGGTVSTSGLYTAPTTSGTYQLAAVSTVNPAAVALATVTVS